MLHILQRVYAGDKDRRGDQQPEEEADLVDLHRDADGVAAGHRAVAHPVADDLVIEHDGLDEHDHAAKSDRSGEEGDEVAQELRLPHEDDQERAEEQRHHRVDREVLITQETHPLSLLISLVSIVPYSSCSLITSERDMAVTQAPITMLVSVSAWGMGSTK